MIAPLTPIVMVTRGLTCQLALLSACMSAYIYLAIFSPRAFLGNLTWAVGVFNKLYGM